MRIKRLCSVPGCGKIHNCKGFCRKHYQRFKRYGDPMKVHLEHGDDLATLRRKFDKKWMLTPSGCWEWTGSINQRERGSPYARGVIRTYGRVLTGHRLSWMVNRGPIPAGAHVLHTCDNSICVNPDHLYLGDNTDNMRDMAKRGRAGFAKVTADDVRFIRASNLKLRELAAMFGICESSVCAIQKRRTYDSIP